MPRGRTFPRVEPWRFVLTYPRLERMRISNWKVWHQLMDRVEHVDAEGKAKITSLFNQRVREKTSRDTAESCMLGAIECYHREFNPNNDIVAEYDAILSIQELMK
jgi:hypothetical protein